MSDDRISGIAFGVPLSLAEFWLLSPELLTDGSELVLGLRFPGQYFDQEIGQHYNYFRIYGPRIGKYTRSDPMGLDAGTNTYSYVGSNPVQMVDPNGLIAPGREGAPGGSALPPYRMTDDERCITECIVTGGIEQGAGTAGTRAAKWYFVKTGCKTALKIVPVIGTASTLVTIGTASSCVSECIDADPPEWTVRRIHKLNRRRVPSGNAL